MSLSLVILFGVVKQFGRFWIWSETECKIPAEYGLHHDCSTIHLPLQTHTVCYIYCTFSLGRGEGGQREDRGATTHKYSSFVHGSNILPTGLKIPTKWMYLQPIKSVKHKAAISVNRSILKKSRHIGFGVFIVHSSMMLVQGVSSGFRTGWELTKWFIMSSVSDLDLHKARSRLGC
jgi:hypothetical protein